jgi:hypothetical protein
MPFLKEGEIRRWKKCSEHLKELDRNVGETEVDQTDTNPGTDYKDICWQDGRRIVELKTLAEQINACDGCDTPLNLMNIEQERRQITLQCIIIGKTSWSLSRRFPWIG